MGWVVAVDCLQFAGEDVMRLPYEQRRWRLEQLVAEAELAPPWALCPMTRDRDQALRWMRE
ncbi:hypothetical protein ACWGQL_34890 [Streptomyces lydicus]